MTGDGVRSSRGGFTIVEILVAIVLLVIGVLALVRTGAMATRTLNRGTNTSRGAFIAQQRLERLRALPCSALAAGTETLPGGVAVTWTIGQTVSGTFRRATVIANYRVDPRTVAADTVEATILCIR